MKPINKCLLWALSIALSTSLGSASDGRAIIEENHGKALLIYNIAKFTTWPPEAAPVTAPFLFTIWNDKPLAEAFQQIEGLKTQGRSIWIRHHEKDSVPVRSDVLIIPKHQLQMFIQSKDELDTMPILTVTTDPQIFEAGAMVLVDIVDDHLSFSVNLGAVKSSGIEISGNLLRHARKVNF
ncbi:MAG: YfiR family protein [Opitutaceae bacterium]